MSGAGELGLMTLAARTPAQPEKPEERSTP